MDITESLMTRLWTKNIAGIGAVTAFLIILGMVSAVPRASAVAGIVCLDVTQGGLDVTDIAPASINDTVNCSAATTHLGIVASSIIAIPPSGPSVTLDTNSGVGSNIINSGNFQIDQTGIWTIEADFFDANGVRIGQELLNVSVSFFVIPESPIGAAALIGSSLAALGAFVGLRRRASAQLSQEM
jgi:hypothetical protein